MARVQWFCESCPVNMWYKRWWHWHLNHIHTVCKIAYNIRCCCRCSFPCWFYISSNVHAEVINWCFSVWDPSLASGFMYNPPLTATYLPLWMIAYILNGAQATESGTAKHYITESTCLLFVCFVILSSPAGHHHSNPGNLFLENMISFTIILLSLTSVVLSQTSKFILVLVSK